MIHVVGDSHACFFNGIDEITHGEYTNFPFKTHHENAPLAYNLGKLNTTCKAKETISELIKRISIDDCILFSLGEVDCRYHIKNQSIKQNKDIKDIVIDCVDKYISAIKEINFLNQRVGVWAPIASTYLSEKEASQYVWILGDCIERNNLTKIFNYHLEQKCKQFNISFFCIFPSLINENGETKKEYYMDTVHLSQKAMSITLPLFESWKN